MSEPEQHDPEELSKQRDDAGLPKDDERLSREHIDETGEPLRDPLGNADGSS
jgi:hypothetical protein